MARVADRSFVAVWRDRIERQQRRGLSIQAFCQEEGVAQGTFYAWKRRWKAEGQPGCSMQRETLRQLLFHESHNKRDRLKFL
jgi:transposase-like protein